MAKVVLNWNSAQCKEGISHYQIYQDDVIVANTLNNTPQHLTPNDLIIGFTYSWYVVGVTNANRITGPSNVVTLTLTEVSQNLNLYLNNYIS